MPTRSEEINAFVDESLGLLGLDKTDPQLRLAFLEGLQKSWDEDEDVWCPTGHFSFSRSQDLHGL
jgi:hypothetical protein